MSDKDTLYARWISGDLSDQEIADLKSNGDWAELEAIIQATDSMSLPKMDLDANYEKLLAKSQKPKADKNQQQADNFKILRFNYKWAIAASVLLAIGAWFFLRPNNMIVEAPFASTYESILPDESKILLNDGSSIQYISNRWENNRVVGLTGEAFFEVEKGSSFSVQTDNGNVEVLGTKFNVRAWGQNLYVECYEGSVRVSKNGQEAILSHGESVNVVLGNLSAKRAINHIKPLWTNEVSRFHSESLSEVFQEMERQFNLEINHPSDQRNFSGAFNHINLKKALDEVCIPMGFTYNISDDQKVVTITK